MKIALAQLNYTIGDFDSNIAKIIGSIQEAKKNGAELAVFSEMAVCGYPPRDFLDFNDFVDLCVSGIEKIALECKGIAAVVGAPSFNASERGKRLFNSAYFLKDGRIDSIQHKSLLPTYDIFDEYRYFEPASAFDIIDYQGKKIAITICEDIWNIEGSFLYQKSPLESLSEQQMDLIVNIAASPFSYVQKEEREKTLKWNAMKYCVPIIYVNHVGAQTEVIFDGGSQVMDSKGKTIASCGYFRESICYVDTADQNDPIEENHSPKMQRIHQALIQGVKDYFRKLNFKTATLGLSGGLDSSLTLAIAVEALGKENVFPILMPSQFSSEHSVSDSVKLCRNLGCDYFSIPIKSIFDEFNLALEPLFAGKGFDVTEENIQARTRGVLLMAYANKFGAILLNTSNKSEIAVGYGTLYGDMTGGISVLGDVYKSEVFELSRYINREKEIIPFSIINKPPSAELRPGQLDTDALPPYEILDKILYQYIEKSMSPSKIIAMGFDEKLVKDNLRKVNINEYKRHQAAPILRVSPKAFGMGRRMPIVGKYLG